MFHTKKKNKNKKTNQQQKINVGNISQNVARSGFHISERSLNTTRLNNYAERSTGLA